MKFKKAYWGRHAIESGYLGKNPISFSGIRVLFNPVISALYKDATYIVLTASVASDKTSVNSPLFEENNVAIIKIQIPIKQNNNLFNEYNFAKLNSQSISHITFKNNRDIHISHVSDMDVQNEFLAFFETIHEISDFDAKSYSAVNTNYTATITISSNVFNISDDIIFGIIVGYALFGYTAKMNTPSLTTLKISHALMSVSHDTKFTTLENKLFPITENVLFGYNNPSNISKSLSAALTTYSNLFTERVDSTLTTIAEPWYTVDDNSIYIMRSYEFSSSNETLYIH